MTYRCTRERDHKGKHDKGLPAGCDYFIIAWASGAQLCEAVVEHQEKPKPRARNRDKRGSTNAGKVTA